METRLGDLEFGTAMHKNSSRAATKMATVRVYDPTPQDPKTPTTQRYIHLVIALWRHFPLLLDTDDHQFARKALQTATPHTYNRNRVGWFDRNISYNGAGHLDYPLHAPVLDCPSRFLDPLPLLVH